MRKNMFLNLLLAVISLALMVACVKADGIFNAVSFVIGGIFPELLCQCV